MKWGFVHVRHVAVITKFDKKIWNLKIHLYPVGNGALKNVQIFWCLSKKLQNFDVQHRFNIDSTYFNVFLFEVWMDFKCCWLEWVSQQSVKPFTTDEHWMPMPLLHILLIGMHMMIQILTYIIITKMFCFVIYLFIYFVFVLFICFVFFYSFLYSAVQCPYVTTVQSSHFFQCDPNPCQNDGFCQLSTSPLRYRCICQSSHYGTNCEFEM